MQIAPALKAHMKAMDLPAIGRSADSVFLLDAQLRLAGFNAAYLLFARRNGLPEIGERFPLGTPLETVLPAELRDFYLQHFRRALHDGERFEFDYECSSPDAYRLLHMSVLPLPEGSGLMVGNHVRIERPHAGSGSPLSDCHRSAAGIIVQCSHCRKLRDHRYENKWDWVPAVVAEQPPGLSHGICPLCLEYHYPA